MGDEEKKTDKGGGATATASLPSEQPYLDEHTTEPNTPAAPAPRQVAPDKWQMPKPKFQQSSGYLPQGYLKEVGSAEPASASELGPTPQEAVPQVPPQNTAPVPEVEPQPDLTQLIEEDPVPETSAVPLKATGRSRLPLVLLALFGAALLLVAFLVAVYFLFLTNPSGSNNF